MATLTLRSFPEPNSNPEEFIADIEYIAQRMNSNIATLACEAGHRDGHMVDYIVAAARRDDMNARREDASERLILAEDHRDKAIMGYSDGQIHRKQAQDHLHKVIAEAVQYATDAYDTAIKATAHAKITSGKAVEAAKIATESADEIVKVTKAVLIDALKSHQETKETKETKAFEAAPATAISTAKTASSLLEKAAEIQLKAAATENTPNTSSDKTYSATAMNHAARTSEETKIIAADAYQVTSEALEVIKSVGNIASQAVAASTKAVGTKDIANDQARYTLGWAETVKRRVAAAETETRKARDTAKQEAAQAKTRYEKAIEDQTEENKARADIAKANLKINEADNAIELFGQADREVKAAAKALSELSLEATQASIDTAKAARTFTAKATPAVDEAKREMDQTHLFLFRNHLTTNAATWHGSLPENVRKDWGTLRIEFLRHFEK